MNELHKALDDISSIRKQVARSTEFRGYGPMTLAATGAFAVLAAIIQNAWVPKAGTDIRRYMTVWVATALFSAVVTGVQMYTRSRRLHSAMSDEMIRMAVEQFLPAVGTGLLLTVVLLHYVPNSAWMLPGLWQLIFSLGIFSSCRFLPRPIVAAGIWYLFTGLFCISLGDSRAFSPWAMGISFGAGQFLVAGILLQASREAADEN
jgi:hypothetical protein